MISRKLALALSAVLLAACNSSQKPAEQTPASTSSTRTASVADTTWNLVDLAGQKALPDVEGNVPDLRLDSSQHRASGNSGCNRFFGNYGLAGDSLRLGPLASTRRACIDQALNAQETAYLAALDQTHTWNIAGDTLTIVGANGPMAHFVIAVVPAPK